MENTIQLELLALIDAMRAFGDSYIDPKCHWSLEVTPSCNNIAFHTMGDHADGLAVKRTIGMEDASKDLFNADSPWHCLKGKLNDKTHVVIYCQGLPPMCRVETYEEEIPKTDIVTLAETVKVKRTRICCGQEGK